MRFHENILAYNHPHSNPPSPSPKYESFTSLPYIREVSDTIRRILNQIGIKVAMKPYLTIGNYLPSLKDPLKESEISGLVYQVPCHDCGSVYIGQTKRDLKSRIGERKRAFKFQRPENSALCEHSMSLDHTIRWTNVSILKTEKDYSKRLFADSWFINKEPDVMNRNDGKAFPSVYQKLL